MVTILGREIPNQLKELTVHQFEHITTIHGRTDIDAIEKHLDVFIYMGIPESEFDDVSIEDFREYVKLFNDLEGTPEIQKTLDLEGFQYTAYSGDDFKLSVRDTKYLERIMKDKHKGYLSEMLAVLFKRDDLSKVEHYTDAHIKHKAKLIRELKAELAIPYLVEIGQKLSTQITKNEATEVLE
jgi:hypothetical protein